MKSKVHFRGHPLHPMLIVFPLAFLPGSVVTDVVRFTTGEGYWGIFSYWLILAGIATGLLAAAVGFTDWLHIPKENRRARVIGATHGLTNLAVIVLFGLGAVLRATRPADPPALAFGLSIVALFLSILGGWLGGELVFACELVWRNPPKNRRRPRKQSRHPCRSDCAPSMKISVPDTCAEASDARNTAKSAT